VDTTHEPRVIGETDFTSGPSTLHEKAIYIVEGQLYQVERFDVDGRKAFVREVECDYYTDAITYTRVTILDTFEPREPDAASTEDAGMLAAGLEPHDRAMQRATLETRPGSAHAESAPLASVGRPAHGEVHVVSRVVGFKKIRFYTNENVGSGELDLPEQQMHTTAYWLTIPADVMGALRYGPDDRRDGVVGLAWAMKNIAQLLLMCDRHDIGLSIDGGNLDRAIRTGGAAGKTLEINGEPNIFIYDNYPGGIGFSQPLYAMHDELLARTRDLIAGCPCESGCPSCVGPEGNTGPLAKAVASEILDMLVARTPASRET
jgi:DEAD/DEAH box helicase domain-containing protein